MAWERLDVQIEQSAYLQYELGNLCTEMNKPKMTQFVDPELIESFSAAFNDAKAWLRAEQQKSKQDKTIFDNDRLNELLKDLREKTAPVKARQSADVELSQSWKIFLKIDKELQKNTELLEQVRNSNCQFDEIKAEFASLKQRSMHIDAFTAIEENKQKRIMFVNEFKSIKAGM